MDRFDIPICIFIFKRMKAIEIIERIAQVKPSKLYIMADQGRDEAEREAALECRIAVENAISWDCEVIKNYAEENRGVYKNIGEGAKWVLRQEKWAIFLEDDNLPEITFFPFCREMLHRYENDTRIVWVCGTNYLGDYRPSSNESYVFTRHMLPCGWASWADKFERFYDGELSLATNEIVLSRIGGMYCNKQVYRQYRELWMKEYKRLSQGLKPISWDYQMDFSIKAHNLLGICPCRNQIKNIGVDEDSIHGGNSFDLVMTSRFCGMDSFPMEFPLNHPATVLQDDEFEKKIGNIILIPRSFRMKRWLKGTAVRCVKFLFRIPPDMKIRHYFERNH